MTKRKIFRFNLILIILLFSSIQFAYSEELLQPVYGLKLEKSNSFLEEPGNVPIQFLRRVGRVINKYWTTKDTTLIWGNFSTAEVATDSNFLSPRKDLTNNQKEAVAKLMQSHLAQIKELFPENLPTGHIKLSGVCSGKNLLVSLEKLLKLQETNPTLKPAQIEKMKTQILPFLGISDFILFGGLLSNEGFSFRINVKLNESSIASELKPLLSSQDLNFKNIINPNHIFTFCQTHPYIHSKNFYQDLEEIPQTKIVESFLASAGLDLQRDILVHAADQSIIYLDFEPSGDNSLPDLRIVAPIKFPKRFIGILDKLKQLCLQLGVYVKTFTEPFPMVKLSYFILPQYAAYAGIMNDHLVIATSKDNLADELNFLKNSDSAKNLSLEIPKGVQRYWRITFKDFNYQLQRLLQSPLLRDKGVPPITNLTVLKDLVDLTVLVRTSSKEIQVELNLPIKEAKN